jgi:hypothetical protein
MDHKDYIGHVGVKQSCTNFVFRSCLEKSQKIKTEKLEKLRLQICVVNHLEDFLGNHSVLKYGVFF